MLRSAFILFCLAAMLAPEADAQIGRLGRRAAERARQAADRSRESETTTTTESPSISARVQDRATGAAAAAALPTYPAVADDRPFPPAVVLKSLLNNIRILPASGDLIFDYFSVAMLPLTDVNGDPADFVDKYRLHVKMVDTVTDELLMDRYYDANYTQNAVVSTFSWSVHNDFNRREIARHVTGRPLTVGTGQYRLDFYIDADIFWRFPFEVIQVASDDPYEQTAPRLFLRGAWEEYGFFSKEEQVNAGESPALSWNVYTQLESVTDNSLPEEIKIELLHEGALVAEIETEGRVKTDKQHMSWTLRKASGTGYFRMEDLRDGTYEVRFTRSGFGLQTYSFDVANGEIVSQGRQVREGTDPTEFIEGVRETWWMQPR